MWAFRGRDDPRGGRIDGLARAAADIRKALIGLAGCLHILL
jgi:hypothetical protein